jgi:hypothetical protein
VKRHCLGESTGSEECRGGRTLVCANESVSLRPNRLSVPVHECSDDRLPTLRNRLEAAISRALPGVDDERVVLELGRAGTPARLALVEDRSDDGPDAFG